MKTLISALALSSALAFVGVADAAPLDRSVVVTAVHKAAVRNLPDTVVALEVHGVSFRGNVDVPEGAAVSVRIRADGDEDWIGRFAVTALVSIAGKEPISLPLTVDLAAYIEVPVLRFPISRGSVLQAADLTLVQREAGTLPAAVIRDSIRLVGRTTKRDLGLNQVIRRGDLEKRVDARRNRRVTLLLRRGALSIAAPGVLRQDAIIGDVVEVLSTGTRTLLHGTLITPDLVSVATTSIVSAGHLSANTATATTPAAIAARPELP
jgi:flagella basal body P-ring formation protein FlgA